MNSLTGEITFRGYRIVNLQYDFPAQCESNTNTFSFKIAHGFQTRPDNSVQVNLAVQVFEADSDYDISPWKILAEIAGNFAMTDGSEWDEKWNANAIAILLPYVRSFISSVTALTGRPTIILPTMNTNNLIKQSRAE